MAAATSNNQTSPGDRLDRLGRRLGVWALGFGLVGLHVGIFLVAATGLILLDLYRSPDKLTVDDGLRTWGSIVGLHALAVTVFQIVRWAIHEEQIEAAAQPLHMPAGMGDLPPARFDAASPAPAPAGAGAWWQDLPGRWRTLMATQAAAEPVATAEMPLPATNGHAPNGRHHWPRGETNAVYTNAWPTQPPGAPPSAGEADHAAPEPAHWSWVEEAAAAWITPHEPATPEPTAEPTAPPDEPDSPSSTT